MKTSCPPKLPAFSPTQPTTTSSTPTPAQPGSATLSTLTSAQLVTPSALTPAQPDTSSSAPPAHAAVPSLSQIVSQSLTWLWPQRIPQSKLTLLDGAPGSGTSLLALSLAASVSSGRSLPGLPETPPSNTEPAPNAIPTPVPDTTSHPPSNIILTSPPANVILIAPHDDAADTILPRFAAANGDPNHLFLLSTVPLPNAPNHPLAERPFCLADDLALLEITSTRSSTPRRPRLTGSPDLISAARSALLLLADPNDDQTRLLVPSKHPLSSQPPILAYQVHEQENSIPFIH